MRKSIRITENNGDILYPESSILFTNVITNINDVSQYPTDNHATISLFSGSTQGTKPFTDGFVLSIVWRNNKSQSATNNIIHQIAFEDNNNSIATRCLTAGSWTAWTVLHQ